MLGGGRGVVSEEKTGERAKGGQGGRAEGEQAKGSSFFQHLRNAKNEDNGVGSCCLISCTKKGGRHLGESKGRGKGVSSRI